MIVIGALLILTWVILLVRYPAKALPISLAALLGLGLVACWVVWQDHVEARLLQRQTLLLRHDTVNCPANRPLRATLHNDSNRTLVELHWRVAAYRQGTTVNLVQGAYDNPLYRIPLTVPPESGWQDCLPLPPLRPGYRATTLEFRAERLSGRFTK